MHCCASLPDCQAAARWSAVCSELRRPRYQHYPAPLAASIVGRAADGRPSAHSCKVQQLHTGAARLTRLLCAPGRCMLAAGAAADQATATAPGRGDGGSDTRGGRSGPRDSWAWLPAPSTADAAADWGDAAQWSEPGGRPGRSHAPDRHRRRTALPSCASCSRPRVLQCPRPIMSAMFSTT